MPDIALLQPGTTYTFQQVQDSDVRDAVEAVDIYDLPTVDLGRYRGLVVASGADQELLLRHRDRIRAFLDDGKVVAFSGHLFRPWLPGAGMFVPKAIRSFDDYRVTLVRPHPVFHGVHEEDLTFRKGVAGFFARGHHQPPAGADVLATLPDGEPIVYVDRVSTRGVILVHAGNDLLASTDPDSTAGRIAGQLVRWILEETKQMAQQEVSAWA